MSALDHLEAAAAALTDEERRWLDGHRGVLVLVRELRRVDELEGNAGAAAFWAGYLISTLMRERSDDEYRRARRPV